MHASTSGHWGQGQGQSPHLLEFVWGVGLLATVHKWASGMGTIPSDFWLQHEPVGRERGCSASKWGEGGGMSEQQANTFTTLRCLQSQCVCIASGGEGGGRREEPVGDKPVTLMMSGHKPVGGEGGGTSQWDRVGQMSQQWWDKPVMFLTSGTCKVKPVGGEGGQMSQWDRVGQMSQQWWDKPVMFMTSGTCKVEVCQTKVWQGEPKSREPMHQERGPKGAKFTTVEFQLGVQFMQVQLRQRTSGTVTPLNRVTLILPDITVWVAELVDTMGDLDSLLGPSSDDEGQDEDCHLGEESPYQHDEPMHL
ncbi:hypothetical protein V8E53_013109 [Lactarius tabidus]